MESSVQPSALGGRRTRTVAELRQRPPGTRLAHANGRPSTASAKVLRSDARARWWFRSEFAGAIDFVANFDLGPDSGSGCPESKKPTGAVGEVASIVTPRITVENVGHATDRHPTVLEVLGQVSAWHLFDG